jgi:NTE family protein
MLNPFKYFRNRRVGLALGSGGAKGISHISVIEFLQSLNISIDMIAGSSIGAVIGAVYCSGTLKELKERILKIEWNDMVSLFDPVFPKSGLIDGERFIDFLSRFVPRNSKIEDLDTPLAIVATDFYSGMPVVFRSGNILEAVRASISIPGVFVPVKYRDTLLIDGGVAKPLPIDVVKHMGAGLTIAVNLHPTVYKKRLKRIIRKISQDDTVVESKPKLEIVKSLERLKHHELTNVIKDTKWVKSVEKWLGIGMEKGDKLPNIFEIISQSLDIMEYSNTMLMLKYQKPTVLIEPDLLDLKSLDFSHLSHALSEGYKASERVRGRIIRKIKYRV